MNAVLPPDRLSKLDGAVANAAPKPGHGVLVQALGGVFPDLEWRLVLSRKGWHRIGGIIDAHGNRVSDNLVLWIEEQGGDDLLGVFVRHEGDGLLATKLCGTTHYLTAKTGDKPWDYVQVEIDELREVTDRFLFDPDNAPDAAEDLLSPENPLRVDPTPLGPGYYALRKAWDISDAHGRMASGSYADSLFALRFFDDWSSSSAAGQEFHRHFVLRMSNYKDRFGEMRLQATPLSTYVETMPPLPSPGERGIDLSRFLNAFDRAAGYPMAWYFCAVCGLDEGLQGVVHAVFEDVSGTYDYLPQCDVDVLQRWMADRYNF